MCSKEQHESAVCDTVQLVQDKQSSKIFDSYSIMTISYEGRRVHAMALTPKKDVVSCEKPRAAKQAHDPWMSERGNLAEVMFPSSANEIHSSREGHPN